MALAPRERERGETVADRILIADDEPDIRGVLALYLENAGYEVLEAADGGAALEMLLNERIDLCLLDIMMPVLDGYHVLKRIRETSDVPVIVISAKGQDPDKILGLNLGADDYLVKPFNPLEAVARVGATLRRAKGLMARQQGQSQSSDVLRVRDLELDRDACALTCGGAPIDLTPVELRIMTLLMEHPGRVFTKQQLYECGWGDEYVAAENSVMVCMSKLRSKLSDDPQAYIKTIRGLGYRLEK
ncbi:MAG: response regulator transcription factor [Atopobiaceae bacterium]|nr:response regulator transcription factor [Atopobiaceae bacterium]